MEWREKNQDGYGKKNKKDQKKGNKPWKGQEALIAAAVAKEVAKIHEKAEKDEAEEATIKAYVMSLMEGDKCDKRVSIQEPEDHESPVKKKKSMVAATGALHSILKRSKNKIKK